MGERLIDANHLLNEIEKLKMSPWFVLGKDPDHKLHGLYLERKEAVEVVEDLCIKKEPTFEVLTEEVKMYIDKIVSRKMRNISFRYNWHDIKKEPAPEGRHILVTLDNGGGDLEVTEIDYGVVRYLAEEENLSESAALMNKIVAWIDLPDPWRNEE